jgi:hypothetical protein
MMASRRPNSSAPSPRNPHTDRGDCPFMTSRAKFATQPSGDRHERYPSCPNMAKTFFTYLGS